MCYEKEYPKTSILVPPAEFCHLLQEQRHDPGGPAGRDGREHPSERSCDGEHQLKVDDLHHPRPRARRVLQN